MKIALISEWLDAWRGGAEASTRQFLYELIQRGIEVHVFTRSRPAATPGMHVYTISGAAMTRTRRSVTFAHRVERIVQADSFDIIHAISPIRNAHIYQPRGGTIAESIERNLALLNSSARRSLKRLASRLNMKQRYMWNMERRIMRDPNGPIIVAISDYVARQLREHYDLPEERIRLIYNGVDPDRASAKEREFNRAAIRREFAISQDRLVVLLVAHNFRLKGVARWLEAHSLLVQRGATDIRTIIVGKGESPKWRRMTERLGIAPHVTFTGPSDRVPAFRHAADVVVHPTYYDPCSRVVLEAMSSGIPCIATRWDGASEVIENGKNGFVIEDPADVQSIADCVERLRDQELRTHIGDAAREVGDRVSMGRHAEQMIGLYEEILQRGSAQSPLESKPTRIRSLAGSSTRK